MHKTDGYSVWRALKCVRAVREKKWKRSGCERVIAPMAFYGADRKEVNVIEMKRLRSLVVTYR